jgi:hypothetical protein
MIEAASVRSMRSSTPSAWRYRPANAGTYTDEGAGPLMTAHPDAFTVISASAAAARVRPAPKALDADLVRTIHGFDALLVLTGSTASATFSPRASCAPGGQSHARWGNRA